MAREPKSDDATPRRLPRRVMPPFAALRAFEAVGQLGGIRRAAEDLGVDHAAVSRHVRALEVWAGVRLIDRGRAGRMTPEGAKFHARISSALDEISQASADLTRRGDDPRLLVWCVPGFAFKWLNARLGEFAAANPDIDLEVRPTDHAPDLARHEADADIRYIRDAPPADGGIQAVEIARPKVAVVASPGLAAELISNGEIAALLSSPLLHEEDDAEWRAWLRAHEIDAPARLAGPRLWHAHLTLDAAIRGQGVALTNSMLVGDHLETGQLVEVALDPRVDIRFGAYVFRARRDRWRNPAIVRFRRWLERTAAQGEGGR